MPSLSEASFGECSFVSIEPSLTNLLLWLDAEVNVTESGGLVSSWDDKRNNGLGFTSSGASRPTKSAGSILASGSQSMTNSTISLPSSYSVFVLANYTPASSFRRLINFGTADYFFFFGAIGADFATFSGNGSASWNDTTANSPTQTIGSTFRILAATNNNASLIPYFNKTAQNTKTGTTTTSTGMILFTGGGGGSSQFWSGNLKEILIYSGVVSDVDRNIVFDYLSFKYGI